MIRYPKWAYLFGALVGALITGVVLALLLGPVGTAQSSAPLVVPARLAPSLSATATSTPLVTRTSTATGSPTPCCGLLTIGIRGYCDVNPDGTVDFTGWGFLANSMCPFPVDALYSVSFQVSADYSNWQTIVYGPWREVTIQPSATPLPYTEVFSNVIVPPEFLYLRGRIDVREANGCHTYSWTDQPRLMCRLPTTPTVTPTPVPCCGTMAVGVVGQCVANQNGTITFGGATTVYNPSCPYPVEATSYEQLQVSADYATWTTIAIAGPRTFTVPPSPSYYSYGETFPNQNVAPQYQWYRVHLLLIEDSGCHTYEWTSQPQFICRLASPTPTLTGQPTSTATRTPVGTTTPTTTALTATATSTATRGTPGATATACTLQFSDVEPGSTFYDSIRCLACRNLVSGYGDGTFRPGEPVTRGQLSKIVSNSASFHDPVSGQTFEDVPPGSTFYDFVERMAAHEIIGGYPCGGVGEPCIGPGNRPYFRPSSHATRGQISKITAEAAAFHDPVSGQTFEDVPPGSTFYDYVERLTSHGIMQGYPCGGVGEPCVEPGNRPYFRPSSEATRGQTSKIVANTFFAGCVTPAR